MLEALVNITADNAPDGVTGGDVIAVKLAGSEWSPVELEFHRVVEWEDEDIEAHLQSTGELCRALPYEDSEFDEIEVDGLKLIDWHWIEESRFFVVIEDDPQPMTLPDGVEAMRVPPGRGVVTPMRRVRVVDKRADYRERPVRDVKNIKRTKPSREIKSAKSRRQKPAPPRQRRG